MDLCDIYVGTMRFPLLENLLFLFLFLVFTSVSAQPIGSWHSYTSQSTVLDISLDEDGRIWAVSEGGVFLVDQGEIGGTFTPTEGMYRINARAMKYDAVNNLLWLGYNDGTFESYDPQTDNFTAYTDIARAIRFSPRGINQFDFKGENLVIATDFGIVVFEPERQITIDTYSNLGDFPAGSRINAVALHQNRLFAATDEGVAVAQAEGVDLGFPGNWSNYGPDAGFDGAASSLVSYNGDIVALSGNTLLRYNGSQWESVNYFGDTTVSQLTTSTDGGYLVAWNDEQVMVRYPEHDTAGSGERVRVFQVPASAQKVNGVALDVSNGQILVGSTNMGIRVMDLHNGELLHEYLPTGPYMNSFSDITVQDGVLASASNELYGRRGEGSTQSGYYLLRDDEWFNFNNLTHPVLGDNNFNSVYQVAATEEYFFFGSWGGGVAQHHRESDEVTIWDADNSILEGIIGSSTYVVASGLDADRHDHLWVVSRGNEANALYRFMPETQDWTAFPRFRGLTGTDSYRRVMVDSYDQIWATLRNDRNDGRGLVVKRVEGDQVTDGVVLRDDAGSGNLPHLQVNTVVQDRRGEVWIGTDRGLARFLFPQRVIDGGVNDRQANLIRNADDTADSPYLLRTSNITSIAVNSANQKWVGTDGDGLWLIEEVGGRYRPVRNFTTENSPMISNTITSLAYDEETGQIFIATDRGLVSYVDVVRGSVAEMDDLFVYPNPFSYERADMERVIIDRLSERTTIRIMTVDGRLVRRLEAQGGRAEWDVRDSNGRRVATGVYIIVSVDDQNDQRGVGKLVVIR